MIDHLFDVFSIISAGHVTEVQCGDQFHTSSSVGQSGLVYTEGSVLVI